MVPLRVCFSKKSANKQEFVMKKYTVMWLFLWTWLSPITRNTSSWSSSISAQSHGTTKAAIFMFLTVWDLMFSFRRIDWKHGKHVAELWLLTVVSPLNRLSSRGWSEEKVWRKRIEEIGGARYASLHPNPIHPSAMSLSANSFSTLPAAVRPPRRTVLRQFLFFCPFLHFKLHLERDILSLPSEREGEVYFKCCMS